MYALSPMPLFLVSLEFSLIILLLKFYYDYDYFIIIILFTQEVLVKATSNLNLTNTEIRPHLICIMYLGYFVYKNPLFFKVLIS